MEAALARRPTARTGRSGRIRGGSAPRVAAAPPGKALDVAPDSALTLAGRRKAGTVVIACGALAREIVHFRDMNAVPAFDVACIPAWLHNAPQLIPDRVREKIRECRAAYDRILVAYADCGTGGLLDRVLDEEGVERIEGPHCYAFYAGQAAFDALAEAETGTFYLTDYMVRHFDRLIVEGLGLDRHPELRDDYFRHYTRCLYIAQTRDAGLQVKAQAAAARLGLGYAYRFVGYGELEEFLSRATVPTPDRGA
ncbi:MAG: DUF1638 domain-containing protein [Rhodospirillaceae bacterium]|nr:DUF1638 domain-containing protein [Rhodospirillaceae bacterium]